MKKHEQQTRRLEKISDFFGGNNFSKLNNYIKFTAIAFMILGAVSNSGASELFRSEFDNFSGSRVSYNDKQDTTYVFSSKKSPLKLMTQISKVQGTHIDIVPPGILSIDISEWTPVKYGEHKIIRFHLLKNDDIKKLEGKRIDIKVAVSADREATGRIMGEGKSKGKHYYFKKSIRIGTEKTVLDLSQLLTPDLQALWIRLDLMTPAKYKIYSGSISEESEPEAYDADKEQIINGGAERGFYGTEYCNINLLGRAKDGKHIDYTGKAFSSVMKVEVDSSESHSGKHSFKITSPSNSINQLYFNPVPVIYDKPVTVSMWMKSAQKTTVKISLFPQNGTAYVKKVNVEPEWQRYILSIPQWGKKVDGITLIGKKPINEYSLTWVRFDFSENSVVWLDDVSCRLATNSLFKDDSSVWISATQAKASCYYFPDEPISANLRIKPTTANIQHAMVSWKLEDFFGKIVACGDEKEVKLPFQKKIDIVSPQNVRGYLSLTFEVEAGGEKQTHVMPVGIIDRPQEMLNRFGMNLGMTDRFNSKMLIPFLRDFRQGSVRLWLNNFRSGFDDVTYFHKAGIYILLCLQRVMAEQRERFFLPKDYTEWKSFLHKNIELVKGQVDTYEILNEPNIWSGRSKNPNPQKLSVVDVNAVAQCIAETASIIRKTDPSAKVAGPTPCGTNVTWIESVLNCGVAQYLDIITEHPYRHLPELPDYEADLQNLKKVLGNYKKKYPIYATESGRRYPSAYQNNEMLPQARIFTARDIRNALVGFAGGVDKYFHFSLGSGLSGSDWHVITPGNGDNSCNMLPGPYLYAARAAADRIENGRCVKRVKMGRDYRCYIFDLNNKRVAVLWKWDGKPIVIKFSQRFKAFDMMGSRIDGDVFDMNEFPIYLESNLSVKILSELIQQAHVSVSDKVFVAESETVDPNTFAVKITNCKSTPISGTVEILNSKDIISGEAKKEFKNLLPEDNVNIAFTTKTRIGIMPHQLSIRINIPDLQQTYTQDIKLQAIFSDHTKKVINVDGDLADWPVVEPVKLTSLNSYRIKPWSKDDENIKVEFRSCWNETRLYMAFTIYKKEFHPVNSFGKAHIWMGDSIQLAFDTVRNASPDTKKYQGDDFEYACAIYKSKPLVMCAYASASSYDSLPKSIGVNNQVECAIKNYQDRVIYELGFPPITISPFRLISGASSRFNFIVNLNNGKERIGWLELTPGIGQTPKRPGLFMDFILNSK